MCSKFYGCCGLNRSVAYKNVATNLNSNLLILIRCSTFLFEDPKSINFFISDCDSNAPSNPAMSFSSDRLCAA